jgi:hypothetical protein
MDRKHSSFLLRCWWRGGELERIEIEHIQSGKRELLSSVSDAVSWITLQREDPGAIGEESAPDKQDPRLTREGADHQQ